MKRKTYLLIVAIIGLFSLATYYTYAMFDKTITTSKFVSLTASTLPTTTYTQEYEIVTVEPGDIVSIGLNITNSTTATIYYGAWYEMLDPTAIDSSITIAKASTSANATSGSIAKSTSKTVKVAIQNNKTTTISVRIGVAYNSSNSFNLPTNRTIISGTLTPPQNAADKIIALAGTCTSWSSGFSGVCKTNNNEYRYVGANVNNWVKFNDDMYRIIGVFDDDSHGRDGENLVKLVMSDSLSTPVMYGYTNEAPNYTNYSINNDAFLWLNNIILNNYFIDRTQSSPTYKSCANWTYYYSDSSAITHDCGGIVAFGIKLTERSFIQEVTWKYGGNSDYNVYSLYLGERHLMGYCDENSEYACNVSNQKIGVPYASDYIYASGHYASDAGMIQDMNLGNQNWLYNEAFELTMSNNGVMPYATYMGSGIMRMGLGAIKIRPAFYLKNNVKIKSGNGTFNNPYILSM